MIVPFKAQHMADFEVQERQVSEATLLTPQECAALEATSAYSIIVEGKVLAVFGIIDVWAGRAIAWSYVSKNIGKHYMQLHKAALRLCDSFEGDRLELYVDHDFEEGHRWAKMLGFELETPRMRKFRPNGQGDSSMYVRIR